MPSSPRIPFWNTLFFQLLALMLLVAVVPLLILGYSLVAINKNSLESELLMLHTRYARETAGRIDAHLNRQLGDLNILSRAQEASGGLDSKDRWRLLSLYVEQNPDIRRLSLLRKDGTVMVQVFQPSASMAASSDDNHEDMKRERQTGFEAALAGNAFIGTPAIRGAPPVPVINVYLPVYGSQGVGEVLMATLGMGSAVRDVLRVRFRRDGFAYLVDTSGRLMAHPDKTRAASQEDMSGVDIVGQYLAVGKTGGAIPFRDKDGVEMLGAYAPVPAAGWGVVVQEPKSDAFLTVTEMKKKTLLWGAVAMTLAAGSAAVFSRRISRPVRRLSESSLVIAGGNFHERVEVAAVSELGRLATTFNYMAEQLAAYDKNMRELYLSTIRALAEAIDAKDPYTRGHSERVSRLSVAIAQAMKMQPYDVEVVTISALLHDIGKIGIRDNILGKDSDLTPDEYEVMKTHPVIGAGIMSHIRQLERVVPGMRHHHETMDGHGYPDGLAGAKIPVAARIIGLADTYDAMTTDRPYQKAMGRETAIDRIKEQAGRKFDPAVVDAFLSVMATERA